MSITRIIALILVAFPRNIYIYLQVHEDLFRYYIIFINVLSLITVNIIALEMSLCDVNSYNVFGL